MALPNSPVTLSDSQRGSIARSLAIFQLGESGGGTRLRHYVRETKLDELPGYSDAIAAFVAEEQSHAALLARLLERLEQAPLEKQWTNSVFRWMRNLVNLEFNIQVLLTAELIAEVYFGALARRCPDCNVQTVARKLLRDEIGHLAFQREFLVTRLRGFSGGMRGLWKLQFHFIHGCTARVVAWDHRHCLRALGLRPAEFCARSTWSRRRFLQRLERMIVTQRPLPRVIAAVQTSR